MYFKSLFSFTKFTEPFVSIFSSFSNISIFSFAVSANTGFLAISNNLPILFDAIEKINNENKTLAANGEKTKSVLSQIGAAVFSFGSILSIGVTLLTLYGKEIIEWASALFEGEKALESITKGNEEYNKSLDTTQSKIADLTLKLKVQMGIMTKGEADLVRNENERRDALEKSNIKKLELLKASKEELKVSDLMIQNYKKTISYYSQMDKEMKTRQLNSDAENRAVERYFEATKHINEQHKTLNKYINEQYNLTGKLIKSEEDGNTARQKAVDLEFIKQRSIADQIKQMQIESIENEKEREIQLAIFKTQKAYDEIDEANRVEKEKLRIAEINYKQRVAIEKANAVRRGDSEKEINANLLNLEKTYLKDVAKIKAENIPEAEQKAYRLALAEKLALEIKDINIKYDKETNEKILEDFKTTLKARKDIVKENKEFEIYEDEERIKQIEKSGKLGANRAAKELRKQLLEKKIALIQSNANEEKAMTENAAKKLEIQNRANIEIEKLRNKSEEEQKKRDMEAMQRNVQYFADLLKAAIDATNQIINLKIKEIDQQSSLQQKRVDDAKNIADRGNAEQLEMEQKRLDDLNKKRENYVRQQQALAVLELVANTAVAVSKAASQTGVAAGVGIAAALLALVAGLASARAIASQAAFYDGGYTGDGNPREESNTIGGRRANRNYVWHKGEFVMDHKKTRKYRDIFEDIHSGKVDLRQWQEKVSQYDLMANRKEFMLNPNYSMMQPPVNIDMSAMEKEMRSINENLRGLYFGLQVDENGFTMRQRRLLDRKETIKNAAKL